MKHLKEFPKLSEAEGQDNIAEMTDIIYDTLMGNEGIHHPQFDVSAVEDQVVEYNQISFKYKDKYYSITVTESKGPEDVSFDKSPKSGGEGFRGA